MPDDSVALIAKKDYPYGKIRVSVGQSFTATAKDADLLLKTGLASRAAPPPEQKRAREPYQTKVVQPVPDVSQDAASLSDESATEPTAAESPDEPKPKRSYRRRDLTPEE